MLISCKIAGLLLEKKLLVRLSLKEKLQLKLHHNLCKACLAYQKQSETIDKLLSIHFGVKAVGNQAVTINENLKLRIISELKKS